MAEPVEFETQVSRRRRARVRPRWVPPPLLSFLLAAFLFALAWRVTSTQQTVPEGWLTTTGVVLEVRAQDGRYRSSDGLVRWTTDDGETRETWIEPNALKGEEIPLAYDPTSSSQPKPLGAMEYAGRNLRILGVVACMIGAFSAWRFVAPSKMPFRKLR